MTVKEFVAAMSAGRPGGIVSDELLKSGWMHNDDLAMLRRARQIVRPAHAEIVKVETWPTVTLENIDRCAAWIEINGEGVVYRFSRLNAGYWPWFIAATGEPWTDDRLK